MKESREKAKIGRQLDLNQTYQRYEASVLGRDYSYTTVKYFEQNMFASDEYDLISFF